MKTTQTLLIGSVALSLLAGAVSAADKEPLKIEVPRPVFIGTPKPIKGFPHLEKKAAKRGEILVPAGTTNIAKDKEVTSSDDFPIIGDLEFVTDGDKDGEEGYFVNWLPRSNGSKSTSQKLQKSLESASGTSTLKPVLTMT